MVNNGYKTGVMTFRISDVDKRKLEELSEKECMSKTEMITFLIRKEYSNMISDLRTIQKMEESEK